MTVRPTAGLLAFALSLSAPLLCGCEDTPKPAPTPVVNPGTEAAPGPRTAADPKNTRPANKP
jgi:hypothetical protein